MSVPCVPSFVTDSLPRSAPPSSACLPPSTPSRRLVPVDAPLSATAHLTSIANRLSRGASRTWLAGLRIGIETSRVLALLALEESVSARRACDVLGMDKASMSRCFKRMQADGYISLDVDPNDGRSRLATLTPAGRAVHDRVRELALERERVFLSVLNQDERDQLVGLLRRLGDNLPAVERATEASVAALRSQRTHPRIF